MVGVRKAYGESPEVIAQMYLSDPAEVLRKRAALERQQVYENDVENLIKLKFADWFEDPTVLERIRRFAFLGNSEGLYRRVVHEESRPVYAQPPTRTITPPNEQERFAGLMEETRYNAKMGAVCLNLVAHCDVVTYTRYVKKDQRVQVDIMTPDMVTIVPDPDDMTRPIAYIYCRKTYNPITRKMENWYVYWDADTAFLMDSNYVRRPFPGDRQPEYVHGLRRLPFCLARRWEPAGKMWNSTANNALLAAHFIGALLRVLGVRVLKALGFDIPVVNGDLMNFPKQQPLDEEAAIQVPEGGNVTMLNRRSDPSNYTDFGDGVRIAAAADHGISRARLGQSNAQQSSDDGLREAWAEILKVMEPFELEQFDVLRMISQEHDDPEKRLSDEAELSVSFGQWQHFAEPKQALEIWREERRQGVSNLREQIKAKYRDIQTDAEADAKIEENMDVEARIAEQRRAKNISENGDIQNGGQTPEANGRLGPLVRDHEMTSEEASNQARKPRLRIVDPDEDKEK